MSKYGIRYIDASVTLINMQVKQGDIYCEGGKISRRKTIWHRGLKYWNRPFLSLYSVNMGEFPLTAPAS